MQTTMVRAVVVMAALAFTAIVALAVLRPGDATAIGHILTITIPTTTALLALLSSQANGRKADAQSEKTDAIHDAVNGLNAKRMADAHAAGVADERARREGP